MSFGYGECNVKKSKMPPYISVSGFESALKVVSRLRKGTAFGKTEMRKTGLQRNTQYQAVNALKFFGILDKEKKVTERKDIFAPENKQKMQKFVREKYSPLFKRLKIPADRNDVIATIKKVYQCGGSVAPLAATFFTWASGISGLKVLEEGAGARASGRRGRPSLQEARSRKRVGKSRPGRPPSTSRPQVVYTFSFHIDSKTTTNQVRRMIKNVEEGRRG